jgi:cytochrome subunit of sulfide dehydrogenase
MRSLSLRWRTALAITAVSMAGHGVATAEKIDAQRVYALSLAATCANCHGTNGVSVAGNQMPLINDLTAQQISSRLQDYKNGTRTGTIMPQLAKGYTDEQIEVIAQVLGVKK